MNFLIKKHQDTIINIGDIINKIINYSILNIRMIVFRFDDKSYIFTDKDISIFDTTIYKNVGKYNHYNEIKNEFELYCKYSYTILFYQDLNELRIDDILNKYLCTIYIGHFGNKYKVYRFKNGSRVNNLIGLPEIFSKLKELINDNI